MATIFVSHSSRDMDSVAMRPIVKAFATTRVKAVYERLEQVATGTAVDAKKIQQDLQMSSAAFVVLTDNVSSLQHTRDWVGWEHGVATQAQKEVWVFEPAATLGRIQVVVPRLTHLVVYTSSDESYAYIRKIVEWYDNSDFLGLAVVGAGGGAALGGVPGAVFGSVALPVAAWLNREKVGGQPVSCINPSCRQAYTVHLLHGRPDWRCPVCNQGLEFTRSAGAGRAT